MQMPADKVNHTCLERTPSSIAGDHTLTHTCATVDRLSQHGDAGLNNHTCDRLNNHTCDRLKHSHSPLPVNSHPASHVHVNSTAERMCSRCCDHVPNMYTGPETLPPPRCMRANHIEAYDNNHVTLYDTPPMHINHSCCSTLSRAGSRVKETPI